MQKIYAYKASYSDSKMIGIISYVEIFAFNDKLDIFNVVRGNTQ